MFCDTLIRQVLGLLEQTKEVNGVKVNKTNAELEKEAIDLIMKDFETTEFSDSEIHSMQEAMNNLDDEEEHTYNLEHLSGDASRKREELSLKARKIVAKSCIRKAMSEHMLPAIDKPGINRAVINFLQPDIDKLSLEEIYAFNDKFTAMTAQQKHEYFKSNLNRMNAFIHKIMNVETDEEFVEAVKDDFSLFHVIGELQYEEAAIDCLADNFGIVVDEEDKTLWKNIADIAVGMVGKKNIMGGIASPYYAKYKDMKSLFQLSTDVWFNLRDDGISKRIRDIGQDSANVGSLEKNYESTGHYFSPFFHLGNGNGVLYSSKPYEKGLYADILKEHAEQVSKNITYRDTEGKELTLEEASILLYDKKYVDVYDGETFKERFKKTANICLNHAHDEKKLSIRTSKTLDVEALLKDVKEKLDAENPLYIRMQASMGLGNSGKYQKAVDDIDTLLKGDLADPAKILNGLKSLSKDMDSYLSEKLTDGKEKSEITDRRENAMLSAYNIIAATLSYNLSLSNEPQPISLDFLENPEDEEEVNAFGLEEKKEENIIINDMPEK